MFSFALHNLAIWYAVVSTCVDRHCFQFRDVKPEYFWFRWISFVINFVIAVQSVLNTSPLTRVFSSAFVFSVEFVLVW